MLFVFFEQSTKQKQKTV